ncbi:MAG: hypothetical protein ABW003_20895 [Microvirga sp.]
MPQFGRDENGASAAEYAMVLAIIGSAIAMAVVSLGGTISTSLNQSSVTIAGGETDAGAASPGNNGSAPGQTGSTPGQSGSAPGQSGSNPGQGGSSPGNSGNAPGKNK